MPGEKTDDRHRCRKRHSPGSGEPAFHDSACSRIVSSAASRNVGTPPPRECCCVYEIRDGLRRQEVDLAMRQGACRARASPAATHDAARGLRPRVKTMPQPSGCLETEMSRDHVSHREIAQFAADRMNLLVYGYLFADRTYSSGGRALDRSSVRSY